MGNRLAMDVGAVGGRQGRVRELVCVRSCK